MFVEAANASKELAHMDIHMGNATLSASEGDDEHPQLEQGDIYRSDLMQVRPVPNAGLGLFATAPIPAGTRLIAESAIIDLPLTADPPDLYAQLTSLPQHRQQAYLSLAAHPRRDESPDWIPAARAAYTGPSSAFESHCATMLHAWLIYETNRFTVRSGPHGAKDRMGVFPLTSRLNHDCQPNVFHRHNHAINKLTIHALRDVPPGEQLCTSYVDVARPTGDRRRSLKHWGFSCGCALCHDELSKQRDDGARAAIETAFARLKRREGKRVEAEREWGRKECAAGVRAARELVALMDREGLDESDTVGEVLAIGAEYAVGCGEWDTAVEWAERGVEVEERCLGRDSSEWAEAEARLRRARDGLMAATTG